MKKPIFAFFLIITLMFAAPVCAEIYKYIDENGQKRWTDDLSQVPEEQRSSIVRYEAVEETPAAAAAKQAEKTQSESAPETQAAVPNTDQPDETAELSRKALEKEKEDLDTQYEQLIEERKQLEQIKAEALSAEARKKLNERISAYNSNTERYETQLTNFNEKIDAYNQKITSKQSPQGE